MNPLRMWLCGLAALLLFLSPAVAEEDAFGSEDAPKKLKKDKKARMNKGARKARAKKGLRGEYQIMAAVLDFDAEQKSSLEQAVKAHNAAVKEWNESNAETLKTLKSDMKQAKQDKDKDKLKELSEQHKKLEAERKQLEADLRTKVMAIMTDEQKGQWQQFLIYRQVARRFGRVKLDDDQKAKVKTIVAEKSGEMTGDRKKDREVYKAIHEEVVASVLTDEQKEQMQRKGKSKRDKADGPRRKKGKKARGDEAAVVIDGAE